MISYYRRKPSIEPRGLELFYSQQAPNATYSNATYSNTVARAGWEMISYYWRKPSNEPRGLELFYSQQLSSATGSRSTATRSQKTLHQKGHVQAQKALKQSA